MTHRLPAVAGPNAGVAAAPPRPILLPAAANGNAAPDARRARIAARVRARAAQLGVTGPRPLILAPQAGPR